MVLKKMVRVYMVFTLFAFIIFLLHSVFNVLFPYLNPTKELIPINLIIFALYGIILGLSVIFAKRYKTYKPLITLGGMAVKMLLVMGIILLFYFNKPVNKEPFIFSLFAIYAIYIPFISYFYIKQLD